ncbi:ankyrin repeat domain-containing protein [Legionella feeleii]|uniref:ankyrin repeat domain-containing protein n=1 Tax=Legionella feeleii TaxID=453 RepID=UPI0007D0AD03|nr:ankyrin repeat domain-containing protein [Legionella feeleii]
MITIHEFIEAIKNEQYQTLLSRLKNENFSVEWNKKGPFNQNILHFAMKNAEVFKTLCTHLKDNNEKQFIALLTEADSDGDTPLHQMIQFNRVDALCILLDIGSKNTRVKEAIISALSTKNLKKDDVFALKDSAKQNILHFAMKSTAGFSMLCEELEKEPGLFAQLIKAQDDEGDTPLHQMIQFNRVDALCILLDIGSKNTRVKEAIISALSTKNLKKDDVFALPSSKACSKLIAEFSSHKKREETSPLRLIKEQIPVADKVQKQENWEPVKNKFENFLCQVLFLYKQSNNAQLDTFSIERKKNSVFRIWAGNNLCLSTTDIGSIPFLYEVSQFLIDNGFKEQEDFMIEDSNVDYTNTYLAKYFRSTPKYSINFSANGTEKLCKRFLKEEEKPYLQFYSEKSEQPPANENPYPPI